MYRSSDNSFRRRIGRRLFAVTVLILIMLMPAVLPTNLQRTTALELTPATRPSHFPVMAGVDGSGNDLSSAMFMTRESLGHQIQILNTYANTTDHSTLLDLLEHQIPGWTLYEVIINVENITAAPERMLVGNYSLATYSNFYRVWEYDLDLYYDHLAQGFYNMSHDGELQNFSILYDSPSYDPGNQNHAYLEVRSDYSNGSTSITSGVELSDVGTSATWVTVNQTAILTAGKVYFAVINGSLLQESAGEYPNIRWHCESGSGVHSTFRRKTSGPPYWEERPFEALVNYTYRPWNTSSNQALTYDNPQVTHIRGNSTDLTGSNWVFSSSMNVTSVSFRSNQSVFVNCDLTFHYERNVTSTVVWSAESSGGSIYWNATSLLSYPGTTGIVERGLNLSVQPDWTATGLYNMTNPSDSYDHFTQVGTAVTCTQLANDTWTLVCSAPNYVSSTSLYDSSDSSVIEDKARVDVSLDVNSTIESPTSVPASTGDANLSVIFQGSTVHTEESLVSGGVAQHQWDIQSKSSGNGVYTLQIYWSNGTEAGYLTRGLVIFYPTELTAARATISSFTDSSFDIGAFFNDTFTPSGLNGSVASVTYSFDAVVNASMFDHSNGTWTETVDTSGMSPGVYDLFIYGEGFAFENRSTIIEVILIHETQALTTFWSEGSNITFVENTDFIVIYRRSNGLNISDATVNVTFPGGIRTLTWDPATETYRTTFRGNDVPPGFGTHSLSVQAWSPGHQPQSDTSQTLTLTREPTLLQVTWTDSNSITYLNHTILSVEYLMSNTTAIPQASVNVTIGLTTWDLTWNDTSMAYEIMFNGTDLETGLGTHNLVIQAWKHGYMGKTDSSEILSITDEPTYIVLSWAQPNLNNVSYLQQTSLYANYTIGNGSAVRNAVVNVTIGGQSWSMSWNETLGVYEKVFTGMDDPPGFGIHGLTVKAWRFGFVNKTDTGQQLIVRKEPTTLSVSWSPSSSITYVQSATLSVVYATEGGMRIDGATVNVTIGGTTWTLRWDIVDQDYKMNFNGTDVNPGFGSHGLGVSAWKLGYANQSDTSETLAIDLESTTISFAWSEGKNISYIGYTVLSVYYDMTSNSSIIRNAIVNVTFNARILSLRWNESAAAYQIRFNESDPQLDIGTYGLSVLAWRYGFEDVLNTDEELTIHEDITSLLGSWSLPHQNDISYLQETEFRVSYRMSNTTPISDAIVNVTIGGQTWDLHWNPVLEQYTIQFNGTDSLPGFGSHSFLVLAWRANFTRSTDTTQTLTIGFEPTAIGVSWSDGQIITYVQNTVLIVDYSLASNTPIPGATVNVTIGLDTWELLWYESDGTYRIRFNGSDNPPGLGVHNLNVTAWKYGYSVQIEDTQTLDMRTEPTNLDVQWAPSNTITYLSHTTVYANFTTSNGTVILGATVEAVIGEEFWDLVWNVSMRVYQLQFNGTDSPPSLGIHNLIVRAVKSGYTTAVDNTQTLTIEVEPTLISVSWDLENGNDITYVQSTIIYINYSIGNGTSIDGANVNVTIGGDFWTLRWNDTLGLYQLQFNGTDSPPGLGIHTLNLQASKWGYANNSDATSLTIQVEPTLIALVWHVTYQNNITYIEQTLLYANYSMSNGTPIEGAQVNVTIESDTWNLLWNDSLSMYQIMFNGSDAQPGLGSFTPIIEAWRFGYANQTASTSLHVRPEPTTLTGDWSWVEFEWTETRLLFLDYLDSRGALIGQATQKLVWVNGSEETLLGTGGTYRILLDKRFDLGYHFVIANVSKYGYEPGYNDTIAFSIIAASTYMAVDWSSSSADYLGGFNLSVYYALSSSGMWVPTGDIQATGSINLTIDGTTVLQLNSSGVHWIANLTSASLGLGPHTMLIQAWAYGYQNQSDTSILTVNPVATALSYNWNPANVTIEYTEYLNLTVDYTYYGGDVPLSAFVNVTINGRTFNLTYVAGSWEVFLAGSDIGIGVFDATISAWEPVYQSQSAVRAGVNITAARNTFFVNPFGPSVSYVENVGFSVTYTQDYQPILGANVTLTLNGTRLQYLIYNSTDEKWHLALAAADIGLGVWNVTVNANKTGYEPGVSWRILTVEEDIPILTPSWILLQVDYITPVVLTIGVNTSDSAPLIDATVWFTMAGSTEMAIHLGDGEYFMDLGQYIPIGVYSINVTVARFAVRTTTVFATLNVTLAAANIQLDYTNTTIYYDEFLNLNVSYTMMNGSYIPGATYLLTINGTPHAYTWNADHWESTIDGTTPGIGLFRCVSNLSAYGFYSLMDEFFMEVIPIPTYVNITGLTSNYVNSTIALEVSYFDARKSSLIDVGVLDVVWPDAYSLMNQGVGRVSVLPDTSLHIGNHTLSFTLTKTGHEDVHEELTLELLPIPTSLIVDSSINEYTNETVVVSAYLNDTHNSRPVSWASLEMKFRGSNYSMEFEATTQMYTVEIWLRTSIPIGEYDITFFATAIDCVDASQNATLFIHDKTNYLLAIALSADEGTEGEDIVVTATVTDSGTPVSGIEVRFVFTVTPRDGVPYDITMTGVTGSEGIAQVGFELPQGAAQVEVQAATIASRTAWAAHSDAQIVTVNQVEGNPLFGLLGDPLVQLMIVVVSVAAIGGVTLRSRRRKPTARVRNVTSILQQLAFYVKAEFCTVFSFGDRKHILVRALESSPEAYQVRAISFLAQEELVGALELVEDSESSVGIHGLELYFYAGKRLIGVLAASEMVDDAAKTELRSLVDAFEKEYETELLDWPNTLKKFETDWVIVGPDSSEAEGIKALIFTNPQGLTRAEIAEISGIPPQRASKLVKNILELDRSFSEVKSGRKKVIVYEAGERAEK